MKKDDEKFDYEKTLKTKPEDSFLNLQTYLYITSKKITKFLYNTPVTSHQVILFSMMFGVAASFLIIQSDIYLIIFGAVLLFYKNVLDKVDGSLARARGSDSRRGRFYDSLTDFIVTLALFSSISLYLYQKYHSQFVFLIGFAAMISSMLQCSYFIYYQVSFIKATGKKTVNRLLENVTEVDRKTEDRWTLFLQKLFQLIYGWQDKLMFLIDSHQKKRFLKVNSKFNIHNSQLEAVWYKSKGFLTTASALSIGTHMVLIAVFAIFRALDVYLFVNLILMNLLLICCIIYRYVSVKKGFR